MNELQMRKSIEQTLKNFQHEPLLTNARKLFNTLGYHSTKTLPIPLKNPDDFVEEFDRKGKLNTGRAEFDEWESIDLLFQLTDEEITNSLFASNEVDRSLYQSYLFFVLKLQGTDYTRTQLSQITREINKLDRMPPAMVLFQHGGKLTFAVIDRRLHKRDESKNVLEKVTLLKDIDFSNPHAAHIRILADLSLNQLYQEHQFTNFSELHQAWRETLDTEELNKQFYKDLLAWFKWAINPEETTFPTDEERTLKPVEHVIRLITRLLFVWFMKEKGLVADELFDEEQVAHLLKDYDRESGDSYYRAVLQNLFFATLNTEIEKRQFSKENNSGHRNFSRYRYKKEISDPDSLLDLFAKTPFINGGLFDCLDSFKAPVDGGYRIDCFSDVDCGKLSIPNRIFFDDNDGLIPLLEHYKFTVEESTPIEQEVALDPELLGKVFENLLAEYNPKIDATDNPETDATARKQSGSYYTPRAIVDYMVEEALVATLAQQVSPTEGDGKLWEEELHYLFDYAQGCDDASEWFDDDETDGIVRAISELKILDPAVGSGAFPMGMLHKLTLALRRLDPDNSRWQQLQEERAGQQARAAFKISNQQERDAELTEISDVFERYQDSDFGRKLYLIQNSIFGVDIQPVACQIAKLRFFISLAIEQEPDGDANNNFGIKPLPNLETRFVATDTLICLTLSEALPLLQDDTVRKLLKEIEGIREKYFLANNRQQKLDLEEQEEKCREQLEAELESKRKKWMESQEREIERRVAQLPNPEDRKQLREVQQKKYEVRKREFDSGFEDARQIAGWKPYDQNAKADWFDPEWMFGITDGFDVVIGNPPYIQLQKEGGKLGRLYGLCNFDSFIKTGDIYCLFYEKANQLLKNGGYVCFITSNKWMRAAYGKKLRDYFTEHTQPVQLLDMGPDVFDATVDTNILLLQNAASNVRSAFTATTIGSDFDAHTDNIAQYLIDNGVAMELPPKGEPWAILSPTELSLKRKIEDVGKPLKDWDVNIYFGIKTGCNEAFIIDESKRDELIAQDPKSSEIIKPLLRGRDIKHYHVQWAGLYMLATGYDLDIPNQYPAIYNHLKTTGEQIEKNKKRGKGLFNRDDQGENWWNLRACAYYLEFEKEKIVWQEMVTKGTFLIDRNKFNSLDTTRILTGKHLTYLIGILNSEFFLFAFKNYYAGGHLGSKGIRFKSEFMKPFPIPPITEANQHLATQIEERVDKILAAKRTDPAANVSDLENEIDEIVYLLYDLTLDEIKIVEEKE